jgi:Ca2+-binding EF-hand superfamily protein
VLLAGGDEENLPTSDEMASKSLPFEDFLSILWAISHSPDPGCYDDFLEGLKVFDKDGNGTINSAELRHVLTSLGESSLILKRLIF